MISLEYHKGSFCVYSSVFCQEGYCSGCEIYLHSPSHAKSTNHDECVRDVRKLQNTEVK